MTVIAGLAILAGAVSLFLYKERRGIRSLPPTPATDHFVCVVTGANRGIGREIVSALAWAQTSRTTLVVCSRSLAEGEKVACQIQSDVRQSGKESVRVIALSLDIENQRSVDEAFKQLQHSPGHVDVLVNNAAFAYKMADTTPFPTQAERTIAINYDGTKRVTEAFLPLLSKSKVGGRVVSVSSMAGMLGRGTEEKARIYDRFTTADTIASVDALTHEFVAGAQTGSHRALGFAGSAYSVSKSATTHYMRVQDQLRPAQCRFTAACPGLCRTGMAGGQWKTLASVVFWAVTWIVGKSARAGADTPAFLAVCSAREFDALAGKLVQDRKVCGW